MKVLKQLIGTLKNIYFIPRNLANISNQSNNLKLLANRLEVLSQKLNDLEIDSISKQTERLSEEQANGNNIKITDSKKFENGELISKIQGGFENQFLQLESLLAIYHFLPNLKFLPATRGWAGSPDFLAKIVELILKEKPLFVLEAGSGVSSVIIGLALKLNNYGESISLEHEIDYANRTSQNMVLNQVEGLSIIKYCPLKAYDIQNKKWKWYEINELRFTNKIDMIVVDGPPRHTHELARYPAIPILHKYFAERFSILLDDSKRDDEAIIIENWIIFLRSLDYEVKVENLGSYEKGMTILRVDKS